MTSTAHLTAGLTAPPKKVGLYDPAHERDACGIGFIADLKKIPTRSTVVVCPAPAYRPHNRTRCLPRCCASGRAGAGIARRPIVSLTRRAGGRWGCPAQPAELASAVPAASCPAVSAL